jgi:hypothetical protein
MKNLLSFSCFFQYASQRTLREKKPSHLGSNPQLFPHISLTPCLLIGKYPDPPTIWCKNIKRGREKKTR